MPIVVLQNSTGKKTGGYTLKENYRSVEKNHRYKSYSDNHVLAIDLPYSYTLCKLKSVFMKMTMAINVLMILLFYAILLIAFYNH